MRPPVDNLKSVLDILSSLERVLTQLSSEYLSQPDKLTEFLGSSFSWAEFYAQPFRDHLIAFTYLSGMTQIFLSIIQADNPIQAAFDLAADEDSPEWQGGPVEEFDRGKLIALHYSLVKSTESLVIWGKWLNELVDDVRRGIDASLFKAVLIDRSAITCSAFADRIALAEIRQDEVFFKKLRSALRGNPRKPKEDYAHLRYLLYYLEVREELKSLTIESAYQVFCIELHVYPADREDSARSLWKFIQRWKKIRST